MNIKFIIQNNLKVSHKYVTETYCTSFALISPAKLAGKLAQTHPELYVKGSGDGITSLVSAFFR